MYSIIRFESLTLFQQTSSKVQYDFDQFVLHIMTLLILINFYQTLNALRTKAGICWSLISN